MGERAGNNSPSAFVEFGYFLLRLSKAICAWDLSRKIGSQNRSTFGVQEVKCGSVLGTFRPVPVYIDKSTVRLEFPIKQI